MNITLKIGWFNVSLNNPKDGYGIRSEITKSHRCTNEDTIEFLGSVKREHLEELNDYVALTTSVIHFHEKNLFRHEKYSTYYVHQFLDNYFLESEYHYQEDVKIIGYKGTLGFQEAKSFVQTLIKQLKDFQ